MKLKITNPAVLRHGWQRKALSLLMLATMASLAIGATSLERHKEKNERIRAQVLEHGQIINRDCLLLRQLAPGEGEALRLVLGQELRDEIQAMRDLNEAGNPETRVFSEKLCASVLRDLHKNPERYLSSSPTVRSGQRAAWNALQASGSTHFVVLPQTTANAKNN